MSLLVQRVACLAFVFSAAAMGGVSLLGDGTRGTIYIAGHLLMSICMLVAWRMGRVQLDLRWVVAAGVLARVAVLMVPPFTTHDVMRYLWDGQQLLHGVDPYLFAPASAPPLDARWAFPDDNASFPTIYPPLAVVLHALCAASGPLLATWAWKLLTTAVSLALLFAGDRLLDAHGARRHLALLALSPLAVLEAGVGAHIDVTAALGLCLALLALSRGRDGRAGCWLGVAVLLKLTPAVLLAPLALGLERARAGRVVLGCLLVIVAGYGLALASGLRPLGNLIVFFAKWRFGSPLYVPLDALLKDVSLAPVLAPLGVILLVAVAVHARRQGALVDGLRRSLCLPFVLSPVVFPWYLLVLAPVVALRPSAVTLGWMLTLPLSYEVIDTFERTGSWQPAAWPLVVIAVGWAVGLAIDLRQRADWR
ncbi:MAG: glycosyltransferase 87 family protein [Pseudomonadota bacterium]